MKHLNFITVGLLLIASTSCQKEELEPSRSQEYPSTFKVDESHVNKVRKTGDDDDETFFIKGKVKNVMNAGIPNAELKLKDLGSSEFIDSTTSNQYGDYEFTNIDSISYAELSIEAQGYNSVFDSMSVDVNLEIDYTLVN